MSREFSLLIVCSSQVTLHPITLQNGNGEDSATAHSNDATGHRVVRWGLGGGAGEGVSPVSSVWGRSTVTIRAAPSLTVISLLMGCSAFGGCTTQPPNYQAEEEFETRDSFFDLSNVSSSRWAGLWKLLVENLPKAKLPHLLENIDN